MTLALSPRRLVLVALTALATGALAATQLGCGGGDDDSSVASGGELTELAKEAGHTVYWAGERPDTETEFEQTGDGNVFIRYREDGSDDAKESSLTIGSYPVRDAVASLKPLSERPGVNTFPLPGREDVLVVSSESTPTSVYMGFPNSDAQVEVYHPDPATALQVALSGKIAPLD